MDNKPSFAQLLPLYSRIGWAVLVAFAFTGVLLGHGGPAAAIALVSAVMWTLMRILVEGIESYKVLRLLKQQATEKKPPTPTSVT
jgi:hypothetical protein